MAEIKLVDTISSYGRAEQQISLNTDFVRFLRNKYGVSEIKSISAMEVGKKYNLAGVTFGNYLTQEERYFMLFKVAKQLELLSKIKGSNDLGKGMLVVSLGAQGHGGRSNAHYSPSGNVINLARGRKTNYDDFMKGENSFVHEYGHFLDFYQGHFKDKSLSYNWASENENMKWPNKNTLLISSVTQTIVDDEKYMEGLGESRYLRSRIEIWARIFEASVTAIVREKYPDYDRFFDRKYNEHIYYPVAQIRKKKIDQKIAKTIKSI